MQCLPSERDPQALDDEIRRELKRRCPDTIRLLRLKKLKLAVKDRLHFQRSARRA
jgi:hypothetical protein